MPGRQTSDPRMGKFLNSIVELAKNDAETCVPKDIEDEFLEIIMAFEDFSECGEVFYDSVVTMRHEAGAKW